MWVFSSASFLSVVADRDDPNRLLVRGRRAGDIESLFPLATVRKTPAGDYRYRASISRQLVAETIADSVRNVQYDNFKDSVADHALHASYLAVWQVMRNLQQQLLGRRRNRVT